MKPFASIVLVLALLVSALSSTAGETALSALRALPKADARNLVRIAARDGLTSPEHWYFTVYDPTAQSSLRVLVVAKGEVVTSQEVPPAEAATLSKELLDGAAITVDSNQAAELTLSYAAANQAKVTFLNYELTRQGAKAVPVWVVSCLDRDTTPLGSLVITSSRGNVVASEGFPNKPGAVLARQAIPAKRTESLIQSSGIDPRVTTSDQEFLAAQSKGAAVPPSPAEPTQVVADEPATSEPPARAEVAAPIATARGKTSQVVKTKATPTPAPRIASRQRDETTADVTAAPEPRFDDRDRDSDWDPSRDKGRNTEVWDRTHRRVEPFLPEEDEAPRKKLHIGRFIKRILPF